MAKPKVLTNEGQMSINKKAGESLPFLFYDAFMTPIVVDNFRFARIDVKIKLVAIHKGIHETESYRPENERNC